MTRSLDSRDLVPYSGDDSFRVERLGTSYVTDRLGSDSSGTISYAFNSLGYRSEEFRPEASHHIFVFGESHAMAGALAQDQGWPEQFARQWCARRGLRREAVNLMIFAEGAASNAFITRTMMEQCARFEPDLVLMHFADSERTELHTHGRPARIWRWVQGRELRQKLKRLGHDHPGERLLRDMSERGREFFEAATLESCAEETLRNILLAQSFLKRRGIRAFATLNRATELRQIVDEHPESLGRLAQRIDPAFLSDNCLSQMELDRAVDGSHFGARTHAAFATRLFDEFESQNSG